MRGEFNSTFSVRYGSRSVIGPPGVVYAVDIPCRVVEQRQITQIQFDFSSAGAWVTNDVVDFNGPFTSSPWLGAIFTDQLAADEVQFSVFMGEWWSVCRIEEVVPYGGARYRRALVIPLSSIQFPFWPPPVSPPPPPPPPAPPIVEPGRDCGTSEFVDPFVTRRLETLDDGRNGYYYVDLRLDSPGTVSISIPDGTDPNARVDIYYDDSNSDCCAAPRQAVLQVGTRMCYGITMFADISRHICLHVVNDDDSGDLVYADVTTSPTAC